MVDSHLFASVQGTDNQGGGREMNGTGVNLKGRGISGGDTTSLKWETITRQKSMGR